MLIFSQQIKRFIFQLISYLKMSWNYIILNSRKFKNWSNSFIKQLHLFILKIIVIWKMILMFDLSIFKKMTDIFISQEFINVRNWYNKAIWSLIKIKNYEKWIIKWNLIVNYIQNKKMKFIMKLLEWIENFYSVIN